MVTRKPGRDPVLVNVTVAEAVVPRDKQNEGKKGGGKEGVTGVYRKIRQTRKRWQGKHIFATARGRGRSGR